MGSLRSLKKKLDSQRTICIYYDLVKKKNFCHESFLSLTAVPGVLFDVSHLDVCLMSSRKIPVNSVSTQSQLLSLTAKCADASEQDATRAWNWFKSTADRALNLDKGTSGGRIILVRSHRPRYLWEIMGCVCTSVVFGDTSLSPSNQVYVSLDILCSNIKELEISPPD